jgi:hypothetical protein
VLLRHSFFRTHDPYHCVSIRGITQYSILFTCCQFLCMDTVLVGEDENAQARLPMPPLSHTASRLWRATRTRNISKQNSLHRIRMSYALELTAWFRPCRGAIGGGSPREHCTVTSSYHDPPGGQYDQLLGHRKLNIRACEQVYLELCRGDSVGACLGISKTSCWLHPLPESTTPRRKGWNKLHYQILIQLLRPSGSPMPVPS